ncbi:UspA domain-containing protein [Caballeronia temeraria]|uniref:UspA domain-containing protein n=1 Tax=Caballeronia temeraria TaxID=1777137 RepID=A0A158DE00_9BURK|nr:UspA domain-containing protein [Caballeronia temeraria]
MYQHILVAVGPSFSETALSTAIERACDSKARLTVLHVIESSPWWAGWQMECLCDTRALVHQLALVIRRNSEKMLARAGIDAHWQTRTLPRDGRSIGRVIANEADRIDADLVILGAKKRGVFGFGVSPVRNAVCRHTNREVLIATACVAQSADVMALHAATSCAVSRPASASRAENRNRRLCPLASPCHRRACDNLDPRWAR